MPEIEEMIQQKVRKKKMLLLILIFSAVRQKSRDLNNISQYSVCEHEEVF